MRPRPNRREFLHAAGASLLMPALGSGGPPPGVTRASTRAKAPPVSLPDALIV